MKKSNLIKKLYEFEALIHNGTKKTNKSFVVYVVPKKESEARIGVSLSKKIGIAVERNKIKRQIRMMCMELIPFSSYAYDAVIIARKDYLKESYDGNKKNLEKLLIKDTIK